MQPVPDTRDLVRHIETLHAGEDPVRQLMEATIVAARLRDGADDLIGHFVGRARETGATWAEIGDCLGVTKQAAQKRFVPERRRREGGFYLTRFTEEARRVVEDSVERARRQGAIQVETAHLLTSLLQASDSAGAQAIRALTRSDTLRAMAGKEGSRKGDNSAQGHLPFSSESKKVLELSLREALRLDDRRIGSEHLLLGLLRDPKSTASRVLFDQGVTRKAVEDWLRNRRESV